MTFAGLMGLLRSLGATDLRREGSVAKALLKRHSVEEIEVAVRGLRAIFPKGPISLKMIYGRSTISAYRGWHAAYNAGLKVPLEGGSIPARTEPRNAPSSVGLESVGAILGRMR